MAEGVPGIVATADAMRVGVVSTFRAADADGNAGVESRAVVERAVTAATRLSVRISVIAVVAASPFASTEAVPSLDAAAKVVESGASSVRGAGSRVMITATAPSTTSPITEMLTPRTAGVPVDVSSALSAGLPGRISGVRLTSRYGVIGVPHCAQTSSSSPMMLLHEAQVVVGGTVMRGNKRKNRQRVGRPRGVRCACAPQVRPYAQRRRMARGGWA